MNRIAMACVALGAMALPIQAQAQSGDIVAGALVGALAGAVIANGLADQHREPLREHIMRENRPSYRVVDEDIVVGRELREGAYESYDVPDRYEAPRHRYTVINDRPVVYQTETRRIIHVYD